MYSCLYLILGITLFIFPTPKESDIIPFWFDQFKKDWENFAIHNVSMSQKHFNFDTELSYNINDERIPLNEASKILVEIYNRALFNALFKEQSKYIRADIEESFDITERDFDSNETSAPESPTSIQSNAKRLKDIQNLFERPPTPSKTPTKTATNNDISIQLITTQRKPSVTLTPVTQSKTIKKLDSSFETLKQQFQQEIELQQLNQKSSNTNDHGGGNAPKTLRINDISSINATPKSKNRDDDEVKRDKSRTKTRSINMTLVAEREFAQQIHGENIEIFATNPAVVKCINNAKQNLELKMSKFIERSMLNNLSLPDANDNSITGNFSKLELTPTHKPTGITNEVTFNRNSVRNDIPEPEWFPKLYVYNMYIFDVLLILDKYK